MARAKNILYLSPHFDDLAYSTGGLVAKELRFESFTVANVFTTSKWAPNIRISNTESISEIRAKEDNKYCENYHLRSLNLGFDDSSCRGYDETEEVNSAPKSDAIFFEVETAIRKLIWTCNCDIVFCPLALGNHVDHLMLFQIAQGFDANCQWIFYEDLPYCAKFELRDIDSFVKCRLGTAHPVDVDITKQIDRKMEDMKIYASQTREEDFIAVYENARRRGFGNSGFCERLWIPSPDLWAFIEEIAE